MGRSITSWLAVLMIVACGGSATKDEGGGGTGGTGGAGGSTGGTGGGTGGTGGTSSGGGSGGGTLSWQDCFDDDGQTVQWALNLCDNADTCTMVEHQIDCCGTIMFVGVTEDALADFEACEAAWRATLPLCDCPMGLPQVQQPYGQTVDSENDAGVSCTNWTMDSGLCLTEPN
ncbi:MAG: hypothetical protein JRI68_01115 [Deltaproteobacteria bacterium]|nr:hypothetical protein [Deltaproteobacteria bacterium]